MGLPAVGAKTRPALATLGGLVAAVAVLQIGQQVAGVFAPRPAVQVALIVAVGLAALVVERIQREDRRPRDPLLIGASLGWVGALGAVGVLWWSGGFSARPVPSIAEQIQAIRNDGRASGLVESAYERVDLRPGAHAYLFVFDSARSGLRMPSSQLRLYEQQRGRLRLQLRFEPARPFGLYVADKASGGVAFAPRKQLPYGSQFGLATVADFDKDGQTEILGDFEMQSPDNLTTLLLPVLIRWDADRQRYVITGLLARPHLGSIARPESPVDTRGFKTRFRLRDVRSGSIVRSYAVSQYVARRADHDVAVAYNRGYDRGRQLFELAAWSFLSASTTLVQECYPSGAATRVVGIDASQQLSSAELASRLPTGPTGVMLGASCLMGE